MGKPHSAPAEPAGPPGEVGQQLRRAREAGRLSITSAAASLRLPPRVVAALEEGDFKQFEPVYVRGYLRNYARLLNLPADPLIETYNRSLALDPLPVQPQPAEEAPAAGRPYWLLAAVGLPVLLWGLGKALLGGAPEAPPPPLAVAETAAEPEPPPAPSPPQAPAPEAVKAAPAPPPVEAASAQPTPASPPKEAAAPAPAPPPPAGQPAGEGPDSVAIRLSASAWVSIRDRTGRRLVYENLPAGSERTYAGQAPFAVVLGNAPAAQVQFNGQPYELPKPKAGTVARFTLGAKP